MIRELWEEGWGGRIALALVVVAALLILTVVGAIAYEALSPTASAARAAGAIDPLTGKPIAGPAAAIPEALTAAKAALDAGQPNPYTPESLGLKSSQAKIDAAIQEIKKRDQQES